MVMFRRCDQPNDFNRRIWTPLQDGLRHGCRSRAYREVFTACLAEVSRYAPRNGQNNSKCGGVFWVIVLPGGFRLSVANLGEAAAQVLQHFRSVDAHPTELGSHLVGDVVPAREFVR